LIHHPLTRRAAVRRPAPRCCPVRTSPRYSLTHAPDPCSYPDAGRRPLPLLPIPPEPTVVTPYVTRSRSCPRRSVFRDCAHFFLFILPRLPVTDDINGTQCSPTTTSPSMPSPAATKGTEDSTSSSSASLYAPGQIQGPPSSWLPLGAGSHRHRRRQISTTPGRFTRLAWWGG
jgi:hypothetical protein